MIAQGNVIFEGVDLVDVIRMVSLFFFFFYNCIVPMGFSNGKFGLPSPGKPAATESRYPTSGAC